MPINGDVVEVINRTSKSLTYQVDGRRFRLAPGPNHILWEHVRYAKNQNPLMGSIDPFDIRSVGFLIGVAGTKDPVSPIEQSDDEELLDRSMYGPDEIVKIKTRHINTRGSINRPLRQEEREDYIPSEHLPPADLAAKLPPAQVGLVTSATPAAQTERTRIKRVLTAEQKQRASDNLAKAREVKASQKVAGPHVSGAPVGAGNPGVPAMSPVARTETITVDGKRYEVIQQLDPRS